MNNETKYCIYCGTKLEQNAAICLKCGREIKSTESSTTKQCRKCKEIIDKKAQKCPKCGAKQNLPTWVIVFIAILAISVFSSLNNDYSEPVNNETNNTINKDIDKSNKVSDSTNQAQEIIEYIKVSKDDLDEALDKNAAVARETYINKYVEITGKLGTVDSELKYISLKSSTKEWDFHSIHCTIKNKEQKEIIKTLITDQEITIKGKITDVGEVLGYFLDITEISAN